MCLFQSWQDWKLDTLCDIYDTVNVEKTIIFCNTRGKVEWLEREMNRRDFTVSAMVRPTTLSFNIHLSLKFQLSLYYEVNVQRIMEYYVSSLSSARWPVPERAGTDPAQLPDRV